MSVAHTARAVADGPDDILDGLMHYHLFNEAERVRWRMQDIPWSSVDRSKVTPRLVAFVRQVALAELTTYAATRRFLQEFADDIDFTQWMSVWFYEETKHPHALMRWMHELGEPFTAGEMVRGRITAPFMKSRFGMLVTNVISEVHASAQYIGLARATNEPVLKQVARHLAGDEARHATSFFSYARRAFERSTRPDEDRLEAFKVLHMWVNQNNHVQHPVNTVGLRSATGDEEQLLEEWTHASPYHAAMQRRACRMVSNLTGVEVDGPDQVVERIRELTAAVRGGGAAAAAATSAAPR